MGLSVSGDNSHVMVGPQFFHRFIQRMGGEAAHIHASHAADGPGKECQAQQGGGGLGVLAVQLKEISHLIQDEAVRVGLPDLIQLIPPGGARALLLCLGRGEFGGGRFLLCRGGHGEQVEGHLPIVSFCHLGLHLLSQGAGGSGQLALQLLRDIPLGLDAARLFSLLCLLFGLPGLLRRLLRLSFGLQRRLGQRREQGVFAPPERLHVPQNRDHALVGFTVRGHSRQDVGHLMKQPGHFFGAVRIQYIQDRPNRRVHVGVNVRCPVGISLIEPIDPPGELAFFIVGKVGFLQYTEIFSAVNQRPDALLRLVPVQRNSIVALEPGDFILAGEFDPLAAVRFIVSDVAEPALAIRLPQKLGALLGVMALHKVRINAEFAVLITAATQKQLVDLVLGDKAGPSRGKALYRAKLLAGCEQVYHIGQ